MVLTQQIVHIIRVASYLDFLPFVVDGVLDRNSISIFIYIILDLWWLEFFDFDFIGPTCFYGGVCHFLQ